MAETREVTRALAHHAPHAPAQLAAGSLGDPITLGRIFAESGLFPDIRSAAQAQVKLIFGRGLGLSDYDSMTLIVQRGKITMPAALMASAIKKSGRYDYRADCKDDRCTIEFFECVGGKSEHIGSTTWTMADAKRAGLDTQDTWRKYPKAMLFARCISAGYKQHCPDALGGAPVYVEGELDDAKPWTPMRSMPAPASDHGESSENPSACLPILTAEAVPVATTTDAPAASASGGRAGDGMPDEGEREFSAVEAVVTKTGSSAKGPWEVVVLKTAEGPTFSTIKTKMAEQMRDAAADGARCRIRWRRSPKGGIECVELVRLAESGDA